MLLLTYCALGQFYMQKYIFCVVMCSKSHYYFLRNKYSADMSEEDTHTPLLSSPAFQIGLNSTVSSGHNPVSYGTPLKGEPVRSQQLNTQTSVHTLGLLKTNRTFQASTYSLVHRITRDTGGTFSAATFYRSSHHRTIKI